VNVPVERFLETIEEIKPDILGFSVLITTAFKPMKQVVDALAQKGLRDGIRVIIGGGGYHGDGPGVCGIRLPDH